MHATRYLVCAVALACASSKKDDTPGAAKKDDAPGVTARAPTISSKNECIVSDKGLLAHVLIPIRYTSPKPSESRQLYQLNCDFAAGSCAGVQLDLDNVDVGKPLGWLDLGEVNGARVASITGTVVTIAWGPLRTLTIDLQVPRGIVRYVESGEGVVSGHVEGRGEVQCDTSDARHCTGDAGCLSSMHCVDGGCIPR